MTSRVLGPAAAAAALLIASAGLAQDGAPAAGAGASSAPPAAAGATMPAAAAPADGAATQGAAADPHRLLDDMSGGPQGSPTAQRGNPQPGTSTSIPTTNPATVRPLEQRGAGNADVAVEDTGFEGQCDPVVSIGCPGVADQLQPGTAAGADTTPAAAAPAAGAAAEAAN